MRTLILVVIIIASSILFAAEPIVSDVTAKQRYPWNGLVDITCKVSGIEGKRKLVVSAVMPDSGKVVGLKNFWVVRNGVKSTNFEVSADGDYRLLWDAKADLGEVSHDNMVVRITLDDIHDKVQLWEGGPYWATTNIGADEPWEIGYYFYWGGIIGYKHVDNPYSGWLGTNGSISYNETFSTMYMHNSGDISQLKKKGVITDNNVLAQGYDAAFIHLGKRWRMPTHNEVKDLKNKCEWIDERINGVNGYIVRGKGVFSAFSIFSSTWWKG